jgi:DNA polymerase-3 subunit beta
VRTGTLSSRVESKLEVIIPARSLQEVWRIIDDTDDPVEIFVTPNGSQVIFHTDEADLVSRVIEGQFPNYRQVIPTGKAATRIVAQREELLQATRLASLFARDSANMLRFQVDPSQQPPLVISANAAEVGDNTAKVDATVDGQNTTIAFNSRFISDALGSLTAPEVALELGGPLAPGVVKIVGDDTYLHVVMPLRIPA